MDEAQTLRKGREGGGRLSLFMHSTSLTHLSKSAFHAGKSAFESAETAAPAKDTCSTPASSVGTAKSGTFGDPINYVVGAGKHIAGSSRFWIKFNCLWTAHIQEGKDRSAQKKA